MSVLDRAIVKAFQRQQSEAAARPAASFRRAPEEPMMAASGLAGPADSLAQELEPELQSAQPIDAPIPAIEPPDIDVHANERPFAPRSVTAQHVVESRQESARIAASKIEHIHERPTYITKRDPFPGDSSSVTSRLVNVPQALKKDAALEAASIAAKRDHATAPVPPSVSDRPEVHPWVWPEICQQLDQFTGDGFRQLAKHLQFVADQGHKVLGFVSSNRNAGRTSVLLTLTRILALEGKTTALLIDADRRHPHLAELSGYDPSQGLSDVLHGQCRVEQAVVPMRPGRISLLPLTDTIGDVEWQSLVTPFRSLLKHARADYDMILVDVGVIGMETKLNDCWLRGSVDAVITISRQLTGKRTEHEVLNWKQIGIESLGVIETFA